MSGEIEVALAELRKMFPNEACSIEHIYRAGCGTSFDDEHDLSMVYECRYTVWVHSMSRGEGPTMSQAMQKVREWKGETNGSK